MRNRIVFSKQGRDKGRAFVVISCDDEYVYLVDGKLRLLDRPKKKKLKHVQPTNHIADLTPGARGLQNADIRKAIKVVTIKGGSPHCQKTM